MCGRTFKAVVLLQRHHALNSWTRWLDRKETNQAQQLIAQSLKIIVGSFPGKPRQETMHRSPASEYKKIQLLTLLYAHFVVKHSAFGHKTRNVKYKIVGGPDLWHRWSVYLSPLKSSSVVDFRIALPGDKIIEPVCSARSNCGNSAWHNTGLHRHRLNYHFQRACIIPSDWNNACINQNGEQ